MARRYQCPLPEYPDGWIEIPDEWLGSHAVKRDEVIGRIPEGTGATAANWMVATALLENWGDIKPMNGNPDQWDYPNIQLKLIAWINAVVNVDYNECFNVKKNYLTPLSNGQTAKTIAKVYGDLVKMP